MVSRYFPEIKLLLDYIYFRFTILVDVNTPGNGLQNLKYKFANHRSKIVLLLLTVLGPYVGSKI